MKIGLDVMGGDFAPKMTIKGAILAQKELGNDSTIVLIGPQEVIAGQLKEEGVSAELFEIIHAPDIIGMGEQPTKAYSQKPESSVVVGFNLLKEQKIDAFASAGNTGVMLVGSVYGIGPIDGVQRPCTTAIIPKENGSVTILLDIGTNPDTKPDVLYQFGILGSLYAQYVYNIHNPKVGLLNIGEEEEKGNILTQAAFKLMKDTKDFNFIGNVEGRDLFKDKADVIVCDGFTGNIVLKHTEAMYRLMVKRGFMDDYLKRFNYENYGGTPILGINSTVLVGHGISNDMAIKNMILLCKDVHEAKLSQKIKTALCNYMQNKEVESN